MKQISILAVLLLFATITFAQDQTNQANDLIKQGEQAYNAKNYQEAFESYNKAIELKESKDEVDTTLYFNAGVAAFKAKEYEKSAEFFGRSAELGFKKENAYKFQAYAYKKLENDDKMQEALESGHEAFPNNRKFKSMLAAIYLKKGLKPYKEGAQILKNAKPLSSSNVEKYNAEVKKAQAKFKEALPLMEKAFEMNPDNENAIKALISIYANLSMDEKAEEMKAKLE